MKYSEKWGDSIDAAVELALQELKLTKEQVNITVLEQPSKGFFGIGSKLAKVRVEEIVVEKKKVVETPVIKTAEKLNTTEVKKQNNKKKKKPAKKENNSTEKKSEEKSAPVKEIKHSNISAKPENLTPVDNHTAKEFLEKTFDKMGLNVSVSVEANDTCVYIDVEGKDTGTVIGKRGQTLDALQYLTSLVVNKGEKEYVRVILDAENYRSKREATLEVLAHRLAEKVKKTGKTARLEPMNPYERKVIHTTLQNVEGIYTRSEGDEPYRKVVIELKR